jgi:hypothetical protein
MELSPTLPLQTGADVFIASARHVHVESGQEPELRAGQGVEPVVEVSNHERQGWRGGVTVSLAHVLCGSARAIRGQIRKEGGGVSGIH